MSPPVGIDRRVACPFRARRQSAPMGRAAARWLPEPLRQTRKKRPASGRFDTLDSDGPPQKLRLRCDVLARGGATFFRPARLCGKFFRMIKAGDLTECKAELGFMWNRKQHRVTRCSSLGRNLQLPCSGNLNLISVKQMSSVSQRGSDRRNGNTVCRLASSTKANRSQGRVAKPRASQPSSRSIDWKPGCRRDDSCPPGERIRGTAGLAWRNLRR